MRIISRKISGYLARMNAFVQESIGGMTLVQMYSKVKQHFDQFEKLNEESDTSNVYTFNADSHIKKMKASKEVDSFKNEDLELLKSKFGENRVV